MAKQEKDGQAEKPEITLESVTAELTALKAKVRRMSDNWKRFVKVHVDSSSNGTMLSLLLVALMAIPAFGEDVANWSDGDGRDGTAILSHDGTDYTLTVDEFAGSGTGLTGFTVTLEDNVASLLFTNGTNLGTCYLDFFVDKSDDAGDYTRLLFPSTGGLLLQTDISSAGTLATKITIASDGGVTLNDTLAVTGIATLTAKPVLNAGADINEDVDIDFDATDEEFVIETSTGAAIVSRVYANVANPAATVLLGLDYSASGDADGSFIVCRDNAAGDTLFTVGPDGDTTIAGAASLSTTLAAVGVATFTAEDVHNGGIQINEDVDINLDAADEEVSIVNTAEYGADGAQFTVNNTDADVGAAMYLARLRYTDDGQANADFLVCEDNNGDDMIALTDGGDITMAGILTSAEAITLTDADGAAVITATGLTGDYDASLILDADGGDDNADTWTITSQGTGNDLSIINHTTEVMNLTSAGALQVDSTFTASGSIIASADIDSDEIDAETVTDLLIGKATATGVTIGATDAETTIAGAFIATTVNIGNTTNYTFLVQNSGHTHIIPDRFADSVFTMPAEAAGLHYKLVYCGGAEDVQDWEIDTGADANYFVGGIVQHDVDDGGDDSATVYSDGGSNSQIAVLTPAAGTVIEMWCVDGTTWFVSGTLISTTDTGIVFSDQ